MRKHATVAIAACLAVLAGTSPALAQTSATGNATGSVTIVQPITVTKTSDLQFGRIARHASTTGTVTMSSAADTVTTAGGPVTLPGITTTRAKFDIAGEGGQTVTVSVPSSVTLTRVSGSDTLSITLSPSLGTTTTLSGAIGAQGTAALYVGGNFSVAPTTATGQYTGSFTVTVGYQ